MGLRRLTYFSCIAELESLSLAAERLRISQPSLSRQIRLLEEELGTRLFKRHPRGMQLTREGEKLQARISDPLRQIELALREATATARKAPAKLIFGLPATVGHVLASSLASRVANQAPDIALQIVEGSVANLASSMARGEIDLSILLGPVSELPSMEWAELIKGMSVEDLLSEDLVLVGPQDCELDPEQPVDFKILGQLPRVRSSHESQLHGWRKLLINIEEQSPGPDKHITSDSFQLTKDFVESGLAYATLPYSAIEHEIEMGRMKYAPIQNPRIFRQLIIVINDKCRDPRAAETLKAIVKQEIASLVANGKWTARLSFKP